MNLLQELKQHNFKFNKGYGQNFIFDTDLLEKMVEESGTCETDTVVEIGAGAGTLTEEIGKKAKKVISFEIDENLKPFLEKRFAGNEKVEMIFEDILKVPKSFFYSLGKFKVVANLPYYITTPILMYFLEEIENVETISVMVQLEVAKRFSACEKDKDYGAISAKIALYGDCKITRIVKKDMFYPQPKIDSAVVRIDTVKDKFQIENREVLDKLVKSAFGMRRKTLLNNLIKDFPLKKEELETLILGMDKPRDIRGEKLSPSDFVTLSDLLSKELKE